MPQPTNGDILTTFQAAKLCGVSHKSIERWIDSGVLRGYRTPGGHRRLNRSDLLKLVAERRTAGSTSPVAAATGLTGVLFVGEAAAFEPALTNHLSASHKYNVSTATSCIEAGVLIERLRPRVIVLDVATDCRGGVALWDLVRNDPTHASVVVIALTDSEEVARNAHETGMFHATFVAPVSPSTLRASIESLVEDAGFVRNAIADT